MTRLQPLNQPCGHPQRLQTCGTLTSIFIFYKYYTCSTKCLIIVIFISIAVKLLLSISVRWLCMYQLLCKYKKLFWNVYKYTFVGSYSISYTTLMSSRKSETRLWLLAELTVLWWWPQGWFRGCKLVEHWWVFLYFIYILL